MPTFSKRFRSLMMTTAAGCATALTLLGTTARAQRHNEYVAGYLIVPISDRPDKSFGAGYSMYIAAWPLLKTYPGHRFQSGLPGTWMFAQYDGKGPDKMYSDIEGGLGWWTDTRFPTETPKFIMGGVAPNFSAIANGPSHGWGDWKEPRGLYGVAQLSPWLLFPIDGLNIRRGEAGELFGYGYLNLPLLETRQTTEGQNVPTGPNCWTLFINSANFKGPVAFFQPQFFSHATIKEPRLIDQLLDTRPSDPNRAVQMETQYIPCRIATDSHGESWARMSPVAFPRSEDGRSVLIHQDNVYSKDALYNAVASWFAGGPPASGQLNPEGVHHRTFPGGGGATWQVRVPHPDGSDEKEVKTDIDWPSFAKPIAIDDHTFGYQFNFDAATKTTTAGGELATLPEYYHLNGPAGSRKSKWVPVPASQVPAETGLTTYQWTTPNEGTPQPYDTPEDPMSLFKKPGPKAGPFKAHLADGSVVTYYWYRFADQPAVLASGISDAEREALQKKVEMLHRHWPKNHNYLPPPEAGLKAKLAGVDPALLVKPPKGLEIGYVPIATRQELDLKPAGK